MTDLRKAATGTTLLFLSACALAGQFQKGPGEVPALPVQLKLPFAQVPQIPAVPPEIQAIEALDPLANVRQIPAVDAMEKAFAPQIQAAANKNASEGELSASGRRPYDGGDQPIEPDFEPPQAIGTGGVVKAPLPNPSKYYAQAFEEAVYQASRKKIARERVTFREVTGNIPALSDGAHLHYAFDAEGKGKTYRIYVDFGPDFALAGQRLGTRVSVYQLAKEAPALSHEASAPEKIAGAVRVSPETALQEARREVPELSSSVSFSLRPAAQGSGFSYDFYDGRGTRVSFSASTRRVVSVVKPVTKGDIDAAVKEAVSYKGGRYAESEYEMYLQGIAEGLRKRGATQAQLDAYFRACKKAPIKGGRFNSWMGD